MTTLARSRPTTLAQIWATTSSDTQAVLLARAYYRCGLIREDELWIRLPTFAVTGEGRTPLQQHLANVVRQTPLQFPISTDNIWVSSYPIVDAGYLLLAMLCVGVMTEGPTYGRDKHHCHYSGGGAIFKILIEWTVASKWFGLPVLTAFWDKCIAELSATRVTSTQAWTWFRKNRRSWQGWSVLLTRSGEGYDTRVRMPEHRRNISQITDPITRAHFNSFEQGVLPRLKWHKLIGMSLPDTREGQTSLAQIWDEAVDQTNGIILARAYYLTGQLPVTDWPLVMMLQSQDSLLQEHAVSIMSIKDLSVMSEVVLNDVPESTMIHIRDTVRVAVSTFDPTQMMLYRLYAFIIDLDQVVDRLIPSHESRHPISPDNPTNALISELATKLHKHFPPSSLATRMHKWTKTWRDILSCRKEYSVRVYVLYYRALSLKADRGGIDNARQVLESHRERWADYPILNSYHELLINAISSFQSGSNDLEPRHLSRPRLYAPVKMGVSPTIKALKIAQLADMEHLISSYASAPSYDQVVDRLTQGP